MRAVWLSSTYYLDPAVESLSLRAEVLFTRALAYCGNAETSGYVTPSALLKLGLKRPNSLVLELVTAGIWSEVEGGGWRFKNWAGWQSQGDALLERQKSDRERQARKRVKDRAASRDCSREVTPPEQSRAEKIDNSRDMASPVPNADEHHEAPRGPAVDVDGWRLVRTLIPLDHPQAARTDLAIRSGALLKSGTPEADIRAALALWLEKPHLGPGALVSLVSEVVRTRSKATRIASEPQLTPREREFLKAELMKDNPDPELLRSAGIDPSGHIKELPGGM